jgi:tetratricopeptide (TPR) repeat protein
MVKEQATTLDTVDKVLNVIPIALALLLPAFFLPITLEFYEFNKLALIFVGTGLLTIAWIVRMLLSKKVSVTKSPLDLGILATAIVVVLATVFSVNKNVSIFGSQSRWFPSLFSTFLFVFLYYTITANVKNAKTATQAVNALIAGITISSIVTLVRYFGIPLGSAEYLKATNFNPTGSTTTASLMAALGSILALKGITTSKGKFGKELMLQATTINFFALLLIGKTPAWATFATGLVAIAYFGGLKKAKEANKHLVATLGIAAAMVLVVVLPTTRNVVVNKDYPKEFRLPAKESWIIATSTLRDFPILGTGPSTFYLNFPRYRPLSLNNTEAWSIRFDKPSNELFNIMGTLGIVGTAAIGFLLAKQLKLIKVLQNSDDTTGTIGVIITSLVVSMTFMHATILTTGLLVVFTALAVAKTAEAPSKNFGESVIFSLSSLSAVPILGDIEPKRSEAFQYIAAIPLFAALVAGTMYMYKMYAGEYYMRQALVAAAANDGSKTYELQRKAITVNPGKDSYHNTYTYTNLALANSLASRKNLSDADRKTVQTLIAQSIKNVRTITEVIDPLNVANWETRGNVYNSLIGVAQDADQWAISSYNTAIQLDPTNPKLRIDLGGVYFKQQDYLSAANLFRQATTLKPDYANAHFNFAAALKELNAYSDALREYEAVRDLIGEDSADYEAVVKQIEELKSLTANVGAQADKPTVQEIEDTAEDAEEIVVDQEPLTTPGEEEVLEAPIDLNLDDAGTVEEDETSAEEGEENN